MSDDRRYFERLAAIGRGEITAEAPIGEKVAHVLRAGQSRQHHCHWPGCTAQVPPAKWGCKKHWFALPNRLRRLIWQTYRPGQEEDGRPSAAYLDTARQVQQWIAAEIRVEGEERLL